ncbi:hypothetical protein [Nocardia sp. NPDC050175]|uniref:hypothetical protein n=1 Tax=Nocardia sp. NPDC050175 TaxID=3364317 RepID=UPI003794CDBE
MPARTSAEETLMRSRAERAQCEQARVFQAMLITEAEQLQDELRELHAELREVYRHLSTMRRRFPTLPPVPRTVGYPPVAVSSVQSAGPRRGSATA